MRADCDFWRAYRCKFEGVSDQIPAAVNGTPLALLLDTLACVTMLTSGPAGFRLFRNVLASPVSTFDISSAMLLVKPKLDRDNR